MKKLLLIAMAGAMALSMTACSSDSSDSDTLVVATNAAFEPYIYYEGEEIVGIDAEIAEAIAEKLDMELEIVDMDFDVIITAVQNDQADLGMGGISVTEEREEEIDFTTAYAAGIQVIIVAEGSDITGPDDLAGHVIGTQQGTTGAIYCADDFGDDSVMQYTSGATAIEALKNGQVDCVVIDNEPAKVFVEVNDGLVILDSQYTVEDYAIAISEDSTELYEEVNTALEELIADGTVQSILDKYISAE